jgi:predicted RNase H-like HicB family nuclease
MDRIGKFHKGEGYMGVHDCTGEHCDAQSESREYLLDNGFITNTLCVHYLMFHREEIPQSEMDKVMKCCQYVDENFSAVQETKQFMDETPSTQTTFTVECDPQNVFKIAAASSSVLHYSL